MHLASDALADALADPKFWVDVAVAVGTIASAALAIILGLRAWGRERRERRHAEAVRVQSQALEIRPGPGVTWWLIRDHAPRVTIRHVMRLRRPHGIGVLQQDYGSMVEGDTMDVGGIYGFSDDLRPGDYIEVHWTEEGGPEYSNGVRITDANAIHFLANGQNGH